MTVIGVPLSNIYSDNLKLAFEHQLFLNIMYIVKMHNINDCLNYDHEYDTGIIFINLDRPSPPSLYMTVQ